MDDLGLIEPRLAVYASDAGEAYCASAMEPETVLSPPYHFCGGRQWMAALPSALAVACDTGEEPRASVLRVREDGLELGPPHALHAEIESQGAGRYSHWFDALRFSTSDGSDPNTNGRRYTIFNGEPLLKLLAIGSCHIGEAVSCLDACNLATNPWSQPELCNSPRELLQLLDINAGRLEVPAALQLFTSPPRHGKGSLLSALDDADAIVLELGTSIDIGYGPFWLSRARVLSQVMQPIYELGTAERRLAKRWLQLGIYKRDEAVRSACAELMLDLIPQADMTDHALSADVVKRARGSYQNVQESVATLRQCFDRMGRNPDLIVSSNNAFTPDGRAVSWPVNFSRELEPICRELRVPLLHPSRMVVEQGAEFALKPDLHHFTPEFLRVLGEKVLATIRPVSGDARSVHRAPPLPIAPAMSLAAV